MDSEKRGPSDVTMSSSDWGPRAKASHPLGTVDQRAMALARPANDLLSSARVQSRAGSTLASCVSPRLG